mgnify:CR=1 FL=1
MDKMKMSSPDLTAANIEKIAEMFPNVVTEAKDEQGNLVHKVDFEKLKQELSSAVIDGDESYDFTWVGKKQAMVEANKPTNKTLRPCLEDSVNWDKTENLYIEGDNLEVLKLLQESYLNKIKMIYIDPPYNTGNDSFIYPDDYATNKDQYDEEVGAIDESGYRMFKNTETNGRFHSSWCSMMYPRLKLARNLLSEDGVIFISIDDNESYNLKKICDEVFGASNFIVEMINITGASQNGEGVKIQKNTESCLVYAKNYDLCEPNKVDKADESLRNLNDSPSPLYTRPDMGYTIYYNPNTKDIKPVKDYDKDKIYTNDESKVYKNDTALINQGYVPIRPGIKSNFLHRWRWGFDTFIERKDEIVIQQSKGKYSCYFKQTGYNPPKNILNYIAGTSSVKDLFDGNRIFDFPKNPKMLNYLLNVGSHKNSIVLDFFSGSATTAHAVMQLNAEDGGKRKFIMVQLPEVCDEKSEAYKAGYKNICEIGKERIRRAGKKIVEETGKKDLDIGFRVLKLDESNMKNVYYAPDELSQSDLVDSISNIKEGRSGYDLLYQCMLDWGLELSLPHETMRINNNEVHIVNDGDLIACFDDKVSEDTIKQIADKKPLRAVFKDSSFATPAARINVDEIFKLKSPQTTIKVL